MHKIIVIFIPLLKLQEGLKQCTTGRSKDGSHFPLTIMIQQSSESCQGIFMEDCQIALLTYNILNE